MATAPIGIATATPLARPFKKNSKVMIVILHLYPAINSTMDAGEFRKILFEKFSVRTTVGFVLSR